MSEGWVESDSAVFIDLGRIFTPGRDEMEAALLQLIPARQDERFSCGYLCAGDGWLSQRVLQRFSGVQVVALDGSAAMISRARDGSPPSGLGLTFESFGLKTRARGWLDCPAACAAF